MTRQQAIKAMESGKKVTHVFFATDEYVEMKNGKLIDERISVQGIPNITASILKLREGEFTKN